MLHRSGDRGAFRGYWVFPGGRVDPEDLAGAPDELAAARRAAVREANEEAGVDLTVDDLVVLSHWMPPPTEERRFSTWFFLCAAHDAVASVDGGEIQTHEWLAPVDALARFRDQSIQLAPPTIVTLTQLADHRDVATALSHTAALPEPPRFHTRGVHGPDGFLLMWEGDAGYETVDPTLPGARNRGLYRPGHFEWEQRR